MDSGENREPQCLLIAPLENHATAGRVAALAATKYVVSVADVSIADSRHEDCYPFDRLRRVYGLDVSKSDPIYSAPPSARFATLFVDWLRSYRLLPESRALTASIRAAIAEVNPDVIITFYGPIGIHYARIVKRISEGTPVIAILNLIPSTVVTARNRVGRWIRHFFGNEFADYRNWLHRIEGIVFASEEMRAFVERRFPRVRSRTIVAPDYLPRVFQGSDATHTTRELPQKPAVIFLGAPERYGGKLDSPDDQFLEIARAGIHVYSAQMSEKALASGFCHLYSRFTNEDVFRGKLAEYARNFDAALITYNISGRRERFRSTFPTRFFTALTAGIPIAVRGGVFDACESFVARFQNGFVYNSVEDLSAMLKDRRRILAQRERAESLRKVATAEAQGGELERFIDTIVAAGSKAGGSRPRPDLRHR